MASKRAEKMSAPAQRAADARALIAVLDRIWGKLKDVPSFTGKAPFMDEITDAKTKAHNLAFDLACDASKGEQKGTSSSRRARG